MVSFVVAVYAFKRAMNRGIRSGRCIERAPAIARGIKTSNPGAMVLASIQLDWVDVTKSEFPESRLFSDRNKLADMVPFDWKLRERVCVDRTGTSDGLATNVKGQRFSLCVCLSRLTNN
jgi:hypothetical protein